ncbi:MAG: hypothetical protein AAGA90_09425 [Actinomycetota bacterium]
MSELTVDELWELIIENDRELAALDPADFAQRFRLSMRGDELRNELRHLQADALASATAEWAERAGRKGEHAQNVEALEAMARMMPSQGAGGP